MHFTLQVECRTVLTGAELRLVSLSLSRKLKTEEDIAAALDLNQRLLEARSRELKDALKVSESALQRAESQTSPG